MGETGSNVCFCPQVWPRSGVFIWGEWCLQAGDFQGGQLLENLAKEAAEALRLCPLSVPWLRPFLQQLLGHCAFLQAHHNHRWVWLLVLFETRPWSSDGSCQKLSSFPLQLESQSQCQKLRIPQRRWWISITRCTSRPCWTSLISTRPSLGWKRVMSCISSERLKELFWMAPSSGFVSFLQQHSSKVPSFACCTVYTCV